MADNSSSILADVLALQRAGVLDPNQQYAYLPTTGQYAVLSGGQYRPLTIPELQQIQAALSAHPLPDPTKVGQLQLDYVAQGGGGPAASGGAHPPTGSMMGSNVRGAAMIGLAVVGVVVLAFALRSR